MFFLLIGVTTSVFCITILTGELLERSHVLPIETALKDGGGEDLINIQSILTFSHWPPKCLRPGMSTILQLQIICTPE